MAFHFLLLLLSSFSLCGRRLGSSLSECEGVVQGDSRISGIPESFPRMTAMNLGNLSLPLSAAEWCYPRVPGKDVSGRLGILEQVRHCSDDALPRSY